MGTAEKLLTRIMTDGSHSSINESGVAKIKTWLSNGGTLICTRGAVRWAKSKKLANINYKTGKSSNKKGKKKSKRRPYIKASPDRGANVIGGAIFEVEMDLTHPLAYGYHDNKLASFHKGTTFMEPGKNAYSTPLIFTNNALNRWDGSYKGKEMNAGVYLYKVEFVCNGTTRNKTDSFSIIR